MHNKHRHCHVHTWAICGPCNVRYCTSPNCDAEEYIGCNYYVKIRPWKPYNPWEPSYLNVNNPHSHK